MFLEKHLIQNLINCWKNLIYNNKYSCNQKSQVTFSKIFSIRDLELHFF